MAAACDGDGDRDQEKAAQVPRRRACWWDRRGTRRYQQGTFAATGIADSAANAAQSVGAIQHAPDKRQVFSETHRILRAGGRLAFSAFEVNPQRVDGCRHSGSTPVPDYAPLLEGAGFAIDWYRQSAGWSERVLATFGAVVQPRPPGSLVMPGTSPGNVDQINAGAQWSA